MILILRYGASSCTEAIHIVYISFISLHSKSIVPSVLAMIEPKLKFLLSKQITLNNSLELKFYEISTYAH